jgi:hypothetical protein
MKFFPVLILSASLVACADRGSDDEQVRAVFASVEQAAEARDSSEVLEHVAASYADANGFDKTRLQAFLRGYFLANPKVEVLLDIESVELPVPGLARVRVEVAVLPAGDRTTLDVELRQEDDEWRVVRADRAREP